MLVLGASSDIGMALIERVHNDYSFILAQYRTWSDKMEMLKEKYSNVIFYQADFCQKDEVHSLINMMNEEKLFPTDIVHLSACPPVNSRFIQLSWDDFEKDMHVVLRSAVLILQVCLPYMSKQKKGRVVFALTSYVKEIPPKYLSSYITSKYALLGLMKSLSQEYAAKHIAINAIAPEMIDTKFVKDLPDIIVEQNASRNPQGRNLCVNDVIPVIQFLLSDEVAFITGENIAITGGK